MFLQKQTIELPEEKTVAQRVRLKRSYFAQNKTMNVSPTRSDDLIQKKSIARLVRLNLAYHAQKKTMIGSPTRPDSSSHDKLKKILIQLAWKAKHLKACVLKTVLRRHKKDGRVDLWPNVCVSRRTLEKEHVL